ncbi:MAG: protein kinase [Planctomycetes bacterium]|nr:protein kinase [Planctomycetota bacterium]
MADAPKPSGTGVEASSDLSRDALLSIAPRDAAGRPTLGGIPLFKKLGQGGMGAVYLGKHPRLGVDVAVKILPFHLADQQPQSIEYFMREANVAARLNHPNLVRIFDVNVDGDPKAGTAIWYLVMEFVSGRTVGNLIRERVKTGQGPLPESEALDLMIAVSEGLAAAHEERIVHRDIKPENIIIPVTKEGAPLFGKAKLMDLGLAKLHQDENSLGLTVANVAMGTPGFMAPEQAESAKSAGPPADVFAMGATLYTLLTGVAPFSGTTVLAILKKTSEEQHTPLQTINPRVSRSTIACVDTCLAKQPGGRYPHAGVLRSVLHACRESLAGGTDDDRTLPPPADPSATVKAPSPPPPPTPPTGDAPPVSPPIPAPAAKVVPRKTAGPLRVAAAVVFVLMLGGGGAAYFLWRAKPVPTALGDEKRVDERGPNPEPAPKIENGKKDDGAEAAARVVADIESALRRGDFARARELLPQAPPDQREGLRTDIENGVTWREAMDRGKAAEAAGKWIEAVAAYREARAHRADAGTEDALRRAEAMLDRKPEDGGAVRLAREAFARGDREAAVAHARALAAANPGAPELKEFQDKLWPNLFVETARSPAKGPVDELMLARDGRVIGVGMGFSGFGVWQGTDLKPLVEAAAGGGRPFSPILLDKEGLKVVGLAGAPEEDNQEKRAVAVWEASARRDLTMSVAGMEVSLLATRLAPFDGPVLLRVIWTPGDEMGPDSYSIDLLDIENRRAGSSTTHRAQGHFLIAVSSEARRFATGGGIYRTWKKENRRAVVDERKVDPQVYLWTMDGFEKKPVWLGEDAGEVAQLAFTPDGSKLLAATKAKKLFVIDVGGGKVDKALPLDGTPEGLSISAARSAVAVLSGRRVRLLDFQSREWDTAPSAFGPARSVLFSREGAALFVGGEDGFLRRFDISPLR